MTYVEQGILVLLARSSEEYRRQQGGTVLFLVDLEFLQVRLDRLLYGIELLARWGEIEARHSFTGCVEGVGTEALLRGQQKSHQEKPRYESHHGASWTLTVGGRR